MKRLLIFIPALFLLCLAPIHTALADNQSAPYGAGAPYGYSDFTAEELEDLVAPIALYPDPLIAQILPAATFIDQIDEAARFITYYGKSARVDRQPWDVSVKSIAHYPDVLLMMDQKYDWTVSLGQAFVSQPEDVMFAIQNLRADAMAAGNLVSTRQQQVVMEGNDIRIYPAEPQVIYVPVYDPQVVYIERPSPGFGFITFGIGFTIGAWLNRDIDWDRHSVFYHGWKGHGWIERSRPHVQVNNTFYINNRNTVVTINKTVIKRDTGRYREQIRHEVRERRELPGRPVTTSRDHRAPFNGTPPGAKLTPPVAGQPRPTAPDHDRRPPTSMDNRDKKPGQPPVVVPRPVAQPHDQRPAGPGLGRDDKPKPVTPEQPRPTVPSRDQRPPDRFDSRVGKPVPPPALTPAPPAPKPAPQDVYRGRDTQKTQPASRSGYGGYGSSTDAGNYRERGAASQENMRGNNRTVPAPQAAPQAPPQRPVVVPKPVPAQLPPPAMRPVAPAVKPAAPAAPKPAVQPAPRREAPSDRSDKEQRQQR